LTALQFSQESPSSSYPSPSDSKLQILHISTNFEFYIATIQLMFFQPRYFSQIVLPTSLDDDMMATQLVRTPTLCQEQVPSLRKIIYIIIGLLILPLISVIHPTLTLIQLSSMPTLSIYHHNQSKSHQLKKSGL